MKYRHKNVKAFKSLAFIFLALYIVLFGFVSNVSAAANKPKGLTLSPLRTELEIAPGTSQKGVLTITNSTDKTMTVRVSAEEFRVINQQYDYAFTDESDILKWVVIQPSESKLEKGQTKKVQFSVGVPLSAEPGGRYISLFASTNTVDKSGGVQSRQRVASLMYINVSGDVSRIGNLVSLNSPWAISGQSNWSAAVQNTGTTHFRGRYSVQLDNLWGGVVTKMSGDALILPGSVRLISDQMPLPKWPGIYKATYIIGLGDTPAKTKTSYILYMPYSAMLLLVAILAFIVVAFSKKRPKKH